MFRKILIANRGEIAVRVIRACRELGVRTVVVYSTEDRDSAAVRMADESVHIGPAAAKRSYLNVPAIMEAAFRTGADAVHPGYGFLSEDADFAEVCHANGIVFIGPPPEVLEGLGDKAAARALMAQAGLLVLPGSQEPVDTAREAELLVDGIGLPVIIKAVAGGGGRGMRIVRERADLIDAFRQIRATAQMLFGDNRVYLERYLEHARHVEVQVLCDSHGNAVHLGERDCTVQRRHQKLIEEAPAPGLPASVSVTMCQAAVRGALAVGYVGAGTFEFLVDRDGRFYFMEVNGRIQVEHPVTEMVTGIDLVAEQLHIASGRPITVRQQNVRPTGTAIECRINAENPNRDFVPTPGRLTEFIPAGGPFVRVDTFVSAGARVSPSYDSLIAKLIVWAPDRERAIARMVRALDEFHVSGPNIHTTINFLREVLQCREFRESSHDTGLVDQLFVERRQLTSG